MTFGFGDGSDFPQSKKSVSKSKFNQGIIGDLKAKSHNGDGSLLRDHSLQAAQMALTVSETVNINSKLREQLRIASFIGGLYHDLGKAAAGFQEMIKNYEVKRWPPKTGGYRHEMLSMIIFLANTISKNIWKENVNLLRSIYLSIIVHHKPYKRKGPTRYPSPIAITQWPSGGSFRVMYEELLLNKARLQLVWKEIIEFIEKDTWGKKLIEDNWLSHELQIPESVDEAIAVYQEFLSTCIIPGYQKGIIDVPVFKDKISEDKLKLISYTRASVTVGDHLSSGNYLMVPPIPDLKQYDIFTSFSPRKFQERCGQQTGNTLLRAPTGSGKTEAALSWIQYNQTTEDGRLGKVFFVLPFQASLNAMDRRIADWIGIKFGMIGLQHSRAGQVLFGRIEKELYSGKTHLMKRDVIPYHDPWREIDNIKTIEYDYFTSLLLQKGRNRSEWTASIKEQINSAASQLDRLCRENFYPIKVTTPHQLIGSLLQGRGWEVSIQEFEEACFIFDEIHIYDAHLTGLILGMAKTLKEEFNAKLLFMSASFPTFLINKIKEYVDPTLDLIELDPKYPSDKIKLEQTRHIIQIDHRTITELIDNSDFLTELLKKESVLIICDTVTVAQNVYSIISNHDSVSKDEIMLFHSRFTMEDRKEKETKIMEIGESGSNLKIIVATQVVEVSLDIDLAFGIFEAAPLDALVQRLGRVNRKGVRELDLINIIITKPEGGWTYVYDEEITQYSVKLLQEVEGEKITEMELVSLIDRLYDKIGWSEKQEKNFDLAYNNEKYRDFFKTALPGTYSKWIDEVIKDKSSIDVLFHEHQDEYFQRLKKTPLAALDLLIPARVYPSDYYQEDYDGPKILTEDWTYDTEFGLQRKEK